MATRQAAGGSTTTGRQAHHFGPRVGEPGGGGMASVVATYAELPLSRYAVRLTATAGLYSPIKSAEYLLPATFALLATAARRPRPIVHVHLADGGSLLREGGLLRLSRLLGLPSVVTVHASQLQQIIQEPRERARLIAVLRHAHIVHVLGDKTAAQLRSILGPDVTIEVFPNCVTPRRVIRPPDECPPRVVFAGEISRRKGVDVLLAAWHSVRAAVPDAELLLLGKPRGVPVPALDGVTYVGAVERERVLSELASCRVAVLPARSEAQPMFILEAMAAGRPVVATAIAEIPTMVAPSDLVPVEDADALGVALVRYLSDPALARAAGQAALCRVEHSFSTTAVAHRVETMYDKALALSGQMKQCCLIDNPIEQMDN